MRPREVRCKLATDSQPFGSSAAALQSKLKQRDLLSNPLTTTRGRARPSTDLVLDDNPLLLMHLLHLRAQLPDTLGGAVGSPVRIPERGSFGKHRPWAGFQPLRSRKVGRARSKFGADLPKSVRIFSASVRGRPRLGKCCTTSSGSQPKVARNGRHRPWLLCNSGHDDQLDSKQAPSINELLIELMSGRLKKEPDRRVCGAGLNGKEHIKSQGSM